MRSHLHEQILVYKIQRGDTEAFAPIYDFYVERVYRFVYLKVPTAQDAEDITAEAFLKVWQYIKEHKSIEHLSALIYKVARNLVVDFYRKNGTNIESIDEKEFVVADRSDLTLEQKMELKSDMVAIEAAMRQLKDAYREVLVLFYLNDLPLREVARIVEKKPGNVRVLLHRGLKVLREILEKNPGS